MSLTQELGKRGRFAKVSQKFQSVGKRNTPWRSGLPRSGIKMRLPWQTHLNDLKWFHNLQSGSRSRRGEGFNPRNIFNISSIESLGPTQELGLRGGFETTS